MTLLLILYATPLAADEKRSEPVEPQIAAASREGVRAIQGFQLAPGLKAELFAAEPMLANPVAFCLDDQGRVYVCESFRQNAGVTDNRGHDQVWLHADLAAQTVEDRLEYHRQLLGDQLVEYTRQDDRVRLLTDQDGDGRADQSSVFANHFNQVVDGTGAGVLAYRGNVYFTCIPHLWLLRDADQDGRAEIREALHSGFGVRVAFRGHDLHGLCLGPDRRLYFSVGDRGYNVVTPEGRLADPESGAVFRCRLDGSELEVFATGLRNPQELAFDDFGNLFTGDNNSDSGDKARWVFVVPGSDSGWRMAYQYLPDRGPFNRERLWHPRHAEQPAYIVPPIANFADGPAGLASYPGVGLPPSFRGRFLLCDFRGGPANSGIRSFRLQAQGAFFELVDAEQPIWKILATDLDFGSDGSIYVSDWVNGWNGEGKGRIYRVFSPDFVNDPLVQATRQLLTRGLSDLPVSDVRNLLGHADRRVRFAAQFELMDRKEGKTLSEVASSSAPLLARIHALWGLGQLDPLPDEMLRVLLQDPESEIRAQAAWILGERKVRVAAPALVERLQDPELRVRYQAAVALGRIGVVEAIDALAEMLADNADHDPIVRHGGIMGLVGTRDPEKLQKLSQHPSLSVRVAAVVALRKLRSPGVSAFLTDAEPRVFVEAARAIHDLPLDSEMPKLAALVSRNTQDEALLHRALNANYRLGEEEGARAIASFAANSSAPESLRREALAMLLNWSDPNPRDRVLGMWRPLPQRDAESASAAVRESLAGILSGPPSVRHEGAKVAARLGISEAGKALREVFAEPDQPGGTRAEALLALSALRNQEMSPLVATALHDRAPEVRSAARQLLVATDPLQAIRELERAVTSGEQSERQSAVAQLSQLPQVEASLALQRTLDRLLDNQIPDDTQLDVMAAVQARKDPLLLEKLGQYEQRREGQDRAAQYRETLHGGDAERGRTIFFEHAAASCVRCHKIDERGGEVGPDLSKIAKEKSRHYLLEALVDPNRAVAKGFESTTIVDADGRIHVGVVKLENNHQVQIVTADGNVVTIDQQDIDDRQPAKSPMPEDLVQKLSKFEIRDLVEFLAQLK